MANYLQKQTALAKKIRKAHPNKKWTDCVKQAARELKKGSVSKPVRKKVGAAKKGVTTTVTTNRGTTKKVVKVSGYSAEGNMYRVRDLMEKDLKKAIEWANQWKVYTGVGVQNGMSKTKVKAFYRIYIKHVKGLQLALRNQNKLISSLLK